MAQHLGVAGLGQLQKATHLEVAARSAEQDVRQGMVGVEVTVAVSIEPVDDGLVEERCAAGVRDRGQAVHQPRNL